MSSKTLEYEIIPMMAFKNEFENEDGEYPGVGYKFGFIRKTLVFLCSVLNN
jgi:hypothetical protein